MLISELGGEFKLLEAILKPNQSDSRIVVAMAMMLLF